MHSKFTKALWLLFVVVSFGAIGAQADERKEFKVFMRAELYQHHLRILNGRDILEFDSFTELEGLSRTRLEGIIFARALALGSCNCDLIIEPYSTQTTHARSIEQVRLGVEVSHPIAAFSDDSRFNDEDFYASLPILSGKDFFVGFYVHEERTDLLRITDPEDVRSLRFAVGAGWEVDNAILDGYGLTKIAATSWDNLIDMLIIGRADAVLQPFRSAPDMGFFDEPHNARFVPIPNMKVPFASDRQFFISKRHPDGQLLVEALNRGLEIMTNDGSLIEAHVHAGVISNDVDAFVEVFQE